MTRTRKGQQIDIDDPTILYQEDAASKNKPYSEFLTFLGQLEQQIYRGYVQFYFDRRPNLGTRKEQISESFSHFGCIYKLKKKGIYPEYFKITN